MSRAGIASVTIDELREFATFAPCEQRYIKRSLDVGLGRGDAVQTWARDAEEAGSILQQREEYHDLKPLRVMLRRQDSFDGMDAFFAILMRMTTFDLAQERLESFAAYRFLYERLLGAWSRPWLPAAFCGGAALPLIAPERRRMLLQSISEAAATAPGWSDREPSFFPGWIEKEAA